MSKQINGKVYITSMILIFAVFTLVFTLIARANIKVDKYYESLFELKQDIEVIKNDLSWIKNKLK